MFTLFKKELSTYFSSLIGYIAILIFLVLMGLFVWIFPDTNVLSYGYASLDPLFSIAPWVFMFLVPAITMRAFSEEFKNGTIEFLATRPLTDLQVILGKYFAAWCLVLFALLPTLLYYVTIYQLGATPGNIDSGATWGSYLGLVMLSAVFVAIGIFASSMT